MADVTFGEKLAELRGRAGLTQIELAERSGVSLGAIRDYEQKKKQPLWSAVQALAAALKVDCREFETRPKKRK